MNGGSVTSRSACGLDCSFSTRDTTSPEPASTRLTLMPVSSVNRRNVLSYQLARPSALYTVSVVPSPEPEVPVPPQAAVRVARAATETVARAVRSFMFSLSGGGRRSR